MSIASATLRSTISRKPNYGIDSPGEAAIGTIALVCAIFVPRLFGHNLRWLEIAIAVEFLALLASMLVYSKSAKMVIRDAILNSIPWRGDEHVLDAGCGRGLVLIGAARRVPQGSAVGVDKPASRWSKEMCAACHFLTLHSTLWCRTSSFTKSIPGRTASR